jgi:Secretion system C-terminal sorting domain
MKKFYTIIIALIACAHISNAQCADPYGGPITFSNFTITQPVFISNSGTPLDSLDDTYTTNLEFDLAFNANSNMQDLDYYEFVYAGAIISNYSPFFQLNASTVHQGFNGITITGKPFQNNISFISVLISGPFFGSGLVSVDCIEPHTVSLLANNSPLAMGSCNLQVSQANNINQLSWFINNAKDVMAIAIEYSTNGNNFNTIFETNQFSNSYQHLNAEGSVHYYRIKIVDHQNHASYSRIAKIETDSKPESITAENIIVDNHIQLYATQSKQASIFNTQGQQIAKLNLSAGNQSIDVAALPSGLYFLKSQLGTIKFVKK